MHPDWLVPDWPAPPSVVALSTTRLGGLSGAPYASMNLGHHVGDDPDNVQANRDQLRVALPGLSALSWLDQVHGAVVVEAAAGADYPQADAQICRAPGTGCAILTADCLPVLLCNRAGTVVAAAHAGWRGLAGGVLANVIEAMGEPPGELLAWLGPAIGAGAFEVGEDVLEAFLAAPTAEQVVDQIALQFVHTGEPGKYLANLSALARLLLSASGVEDVWGGDFCTFTDSARFYSFRREGVTGRMASVIGLAASKDA